MGPLSYCVSWVPLNFPEFINVCIIYLPEVTSLLTLTAKYVLSQLCSCFMGLNMSTTEKDSQNCTMDLSQVEITDVSLKFMFQFNVQKCENVVQVRSLAEEDDEVFTGDVSLDEVRQFLVPYFVCNRDFWTPRVTRQCLIMQLVR